MAKLKMRYLGGGFIPKVPARDLSAVEAQHYGINRLIASGLYADNYPHITPSYQEDVEVLSEEIELLEETFNEEEQL